MKNARTQEVADALRSDTYEQGQGRLCTVDREPGGRIVKRFCCLGVMAVVAGMVPVINDNRITAHFGPTRENSALPRKAAEWLGFKIENPGMSATSLWLDTGWNYQIKDRVQGTMLGQIGLETLNDDWQLPFNQIGDLIAYFGVSMEPARQPVPALV